MIIVPLNLYFGSKWKMEGGYFNSIKVDVFEDTKEVTRCHKSKDSQDVYKTGLKIPKRLSDAITLESTSFNGF
jgi:hypothetical protein